MKHNFDFDDAMTVNEFFKANGVKKENKSFIIKTCHPQEGEPFEAVGFYNGEKLDDGRPSYTFFCLSRKLTEAGEILNEAFLKKHKEDLLLLEPIDDLKFGIAFLQETTKNNWDEL